MIRREITLAVLVVVWFAVVVWLWTANGCSTATPCGM